jgi:hypothetical protein
MADDQKQFQIQEAQALGQGGLAKRFDLLEADVQSKTEGLHKKLTDTANELKSDAREQKSYLMLGFFLLAVMVATMIIMVGAMILSAFQNQSAVDAQLNTNISTLIQKLR